jgi:uncharacterized membrane protein
MLHGFVPHFAPDLDVANTIHAIILQLLRWGHFFFGIAWIGHLYFFNFVQAHAEKALSPDQKKVAVPNYRGRAFWWFRWGAMLTMLTGVVYILYEQFIPSGAPMFGDWFSTSKGLWITFGAGLGLVMWFNVWFKIWPRQQVIIASVAGQREKPADFDALVAGAGKFSRLNTYLSVPMLFGMGARSHFAAFSTVGTLVTMVIVFAVGFGIAFHVVNQAASKVGTEFLPAAPAAPPAAAPPPTAAK